jgi:hypothetical protein
VRPIGRDQGQELALGPAQPDPGDENGVGYVKRNAIAGRRFASWGEFEAHLAAWSREVADVRRHGTTGERPIDRFLRGEAAELQSLAGRPPFRQVRELVRRVQAANGAPTPSAPASRSTPTPTACPGG